MKEIKNALAARSPNKQRLGCLGLGSKTTRAGFYANNQEKRGRVAGRKTQPLFGSAKTRVWVLNPRTHSHFLGQHITKRREKRRGRL
jgi:hypothetical protein